MEPIGKKVFLPNTPSVGMLLYRMKHIVKITPLKFPNGIPENFDPNIHGFHLSPDGKFTITEHQTGESVESLSARADWMKIENHQILVHHKRQYNINLSLISTVLRFQSFHHVIITFFYGSDKFLCFT